MWLPKVTKSWWVQSKSGDLYLALQMAHYGLCLGALQFRLHCVLLHEGGHWIMKSQPFRWEAGPKPALPPHLFFPTWLASTLSHGHILIGGKSVYGLTYFSHSSSGGGGLFRESWETQKRTLLCWTDSCVEGDLGPALYPYQQQRTTSLTGHIADYFTSLLRFQTVSWMYLL